MAAVGIGSLHNLVVFPPFCSHGAHAGPDLYAAEAPRTARSAIVGLYIALESCEFQRLFLFKAMVWVFLMLAIGSFWGCLEDFANAPHRRDYAFWSSVITQCRLWSGHTPMPMNILLRRTQLYQADLGMGSLDVDAHWRIISPVIAISGLFQTRPPLRQPNRSALHGRRIGRLANGRLLEQLEVEREHEMHMRFGIADRREPNRDGQCASKTGGSCNCSGEMTCAGRYCGGLAELQASGLLAADHL